MRRVMSLLPNSPLDLAAEWRQHARCRSEDAEVFFPPLHIELKAEREAREAAAKAICARCPVQVECLEWALAVREPHGVWGGRSESERRRLLLDKRQAS